MIDTYKMLLLALIEPLLDYKPAYVRDVGNMLQFNAEEGDNISHAVGETVKRVANLMRIDVDANLDLVRDAQRMRERRRLLDGMIEEE